MVVKRREDPLLLRVPPKEGAGEKLVAGEEEATTYTGCHTACAVEDDRSQRQQATADQVEFAAAWAVEPVNLAGKDTEGRIVAPCTAD